VEWLKTSRLSPRDGIVVFSVGGGNLEKNISRRVGLDTDDLAKVVHRVRAVAGTAADAEKEQASTLVYDLRQDIGHFLDGGRIQFTGDFNRLL
jgi:hypothetical protein